MFAKLKGKALKLLRLLPFCFKLVFRDVHIGCEFKNWVWEHYWGCDVGIIDTITDVHDHEAEGYFNGANHQIMFVLITSRYERINKFRISIQQLVSICFVLNLEIFDNLISLIANEQVQTNKLSKPTNIFIKSWRFISYLNMFILKEGILFSEVWNLESSCSLLFLYWKNSLCELSIFRDCLSLVGFWCWELVWRIIENWAYFASTYPSCRSTKRNWPVCNWTTTRSSERIFSNRFFLFLKIS